MLNAQQFPSAAERAPVPPARASGVLLHPTSLPGRFGIGDLGPEAYRFVDFLAEARQQVWQVLPLNPTGYGNSPYLCYSAFAGNPLLINLEWLASDGLLPADALTGAGDFPVDRVDYDRVVAVKMKLLGQAAASFRARATAARRSQHEAFVASQGDWLADYALFMALKEEQGGAPWNAWPPELARRRPGALAEASERLAEKVFFHLYLQSEFFRQWRTLKDYANKRGIQIFGDLPIYVAHDSADVWRHQELFRLDRVTGEPRWMAGVPPDYFSATGQLWGNPVYHWRRLERTGFQWWIDRVRTLLAYVDLIRIDHFRGLEAFWAIPEGAKVAVNGRWIKARGDKLLKVLEITLGKLPIVAEDLGVITPEVEALREAFDLPGMKVLHFAFDSDRANPFLPCNYRDPNCVVYTGTHDNNTTVGWFAARKADEQARVVDYLGCIVPEGIHWSMIRLALGSTARIAMFPLQDILGLGAEAKMNTPSRKDGNWGWRFGPGDLTAELAARLGALTELYARAPQPH